MSTSRRASRPRRPALDAASIASSAGIAGLVGLLALVPVALSANAVDRLTTLFVYVILAAMWNALAGYAGLVSVGQQAFFGLGALLRDQALGDTASASTRRSSWPG